MSCKYQIMHEKCLSMLSEIKHKFALLEIDLIDSMQEPDLDLRGTTLSFSINAQAKMDFSLSAYLRNINEFHLYCMKGHFLFAPCDEPKTIEDIKTVLVGLIDGSCEYIEYTFLGRQVASMIRKISDEESQILATFQNGFYALFKPLSHIGIVMRNTAMT